SAASVSTAAVQPAPPVNTALPTITGTAQRTSALASTPGGWGGPDNLYSYQWQRSTAGGGWTDVAGATGPAYTLGVADEGARVRLLVTASNPDGSVSAPSPPTSVVPSAPPISTSAPSIAGAAQRTTTLSSSAGAWSGIGNVYSCQWQRSADGGSTWTSVAGA